MKRDQDLELADLEPEDSSWANFLSSAASLREVDENAAPKVLNALKLEREIDATWAKYLSGGAVLRPVDYASVKPALSALNLERTRARKVWRLNIMKFVTTGAAVAAVVIGVLVFRPTSTDADPNEAFTAYQEASQGW